MRDTLIITVGSVVNTANTCHTEISSGKWVPCRPEGFSSIWYRFKATWLVFTGRADALKWEGQ